MLQWFGSTRLGTWTIKHLAAPLQRWLYRLSRGRLFQIGRRSPTILLLTTAGRKSGKARTTPVFFLSDGSRIVICNVNPGFEHTNPWVLNLRADPTATVQIGAQTSVCHARPATQEETNQYWPRLVQIWPAYQVHFQKSGQRAIFILEKSV